MTGKNRLETEQSERGGAISTSLSSTECRQTLNLRLTMPDTDVDGPDLTKNLVVSTTMNSRIVTQMSGGVARRNPSGKYRMDGRW